MKISMKTMERQILQMLGTTLRWVRDTYHCGGIQTALTGAMPSA